MKWKIIKQFSMENKNCFSYSDVLETFPDKDRSYLSKVLVDMINTGMLMKLSRDLYFIIPLNADPETYSPDSRIVAKSIMKGKEYYMAYATAMNIHGLTDQPGTRMMVATMRQKQPSTRNIYGREFQFVYHKFSSFFGYEETWISMREQVMVSDLEKTIVDAVSKPQFCGGIIEVGKAIYQSIERTDLEKLFYYLVRNGRHAAKKRYLFLSDLLGLEWTLEHEIMRNDTGSSISLLDPSGPDKGVKNSRFGLKINIDVKPLKDFKQF